MNTRQEKVAKQIQKDMADIIQHHPSGNMKGTMLTVTNVRITADLGLARIYISVFPSNQSADIIRDLNHRSAHFRNELGRKIRHQLRKVPEITFYLDDSLDYLDKIENLLKK